MGAFWRLGPPSLSGRYVHYLVLRVAACCPLGIRKLGSTVYGGRRGGLEVSNREAGVGLGSTTCQELASHSVPMIDQVPEKQAKKLAAVASASERQHQLPW